MYISINGLDHERLVGVSVVTNNVVDFDRANLHAYKELQTEEQMEKAKKVAQDYYNRCIDRVRTDVFSIEEV